MNNNIKTIAKCNFPPYGSDFMGGIPTGRFCIAKTPPYLIAEELGSKDLVPAYLDPKLQRRIKYLLCRNCSIWCTTNWNCVPSQRTLAGDVVRFETLDYIQEMM